MVPRLSQVVLTIPLVLLLFLVGCANAVGPAGSLPVVSAPGAAANHRDISSTLPDPVVSYLLAIQEGTDTPENVYRFLGSGTTTLQTWKVVGVTATSDGGEWVFVVCQILFQDGWRSEVPLTFRLSKERRIDYVG